ncbi:MAG: universal stress protein [Deltaproteobacteria bacterium]|nr:universal stress protein [Deltaproteobacteria bacterium]
MFKPSRILVPTDMSEHSDKAIRQALDIAKQFHSEVFVLHVIKDPTQLCTVDYCLSEELQNQYAEEVFEAARRGVWSQLVKFRSMGDINIVSEVKAGVPHDAILKEAEDKGVDLIVLAAQGATGLAMHLMGGVARHLLQAAKCPVLLVR